VTLLLLHVQQNKCLCVKIYFCLKLPTNNNTLLFIIKPLYYCYSRIFPLSLADSHFIKIRISDKPIWPEFKCSLLTQFIHNSSCKWCDTIIRSNFKEWNNTLIHVCIQFKYKNMLFTFENRVSLILGGRQWCGIFHYHW